MNSWSPCVWQVVRSNPISDSFSSNPFPTPNNVLHINIKNFTSNQSKTTVEKPVSAVCFFFFCSWNKLCLLLATKYFDKTPLSNLFAWAFSLAEQVFRIRFERVGCMMAMELHYRVCQLNLRRCCCCCVRNEERRKVRNLASQNLIRIPSQVTIGCL